MTPPETNSKFAPENTPKRPQKEFLSYTTKHQFSGGFYSLIPTVLKLYFRGGRPPPSQNTKTLPVLYFGPPPSWKCKIHCLMILLYGCNFKGSRCAMFIIFYICNICNTPHVCIYIYYIYTLYKIYIYICTLYIFYNFYISNYQNIFRYII